MNEEKELNEILQEVSGFGEKKPDPSAEDELISLKATSGEKAWSSSEKSGCLKKIIYTTVILIISMLIAYGAILFMMDSLAIGKNNTSVDVEIPRGASTQQIADILAEKGIIDHPMVFRIFSKLTKSDGKYQLGMFTLTADMGYSTVIDTLQTSTPRKTVTVTIPEGYTVEMIAKLLEEKNVCSSDEFYDAVVNGEFEYDFIRDIPTAADGEQYVGRIYRLEGYLFPDTYNFYEAGSGWSAVDRMLENFSQKIDKTIQSQILSQGTTLDDVIVSASVIQGEVTRKEDMAGVSRVLKNRLADGSPYPLLQCDSTQKYIRNILPSLPGIEVTNDAYDTYKRQGLPAGAINNPGIEAIKAVLNPSNDPAIVKCYFFATDADNIAHFSETFAQHESVCRKYGIGVYG